MQFLLIRCDWACPRPAWMVSKRTSTPTYSVLCAFLVQRQPSQGTSGHWRLYWTRPWGHRGGKKKVFLADEIENSNEDNAHGHQNSKFNSHLAGQSGDYCRLESCFAFLKTCLHISTASTKNFQISSLLSKSCAFQKLEAPTSSKSDLVWLEPSGPTIVWKFFFEVVVGQPNMKTGLSTWREPATQDMKTDLSTWRGPTASKKTFKFHLCLACLM